MRTLIASLFVAFVAMVGFGTSAHAGTMACLANGKVANFTINWVKGGNGNCPGQLKAADAAALVALAKSGKKSMKVPFAIKAKCDSGWAEMPASVDGNVISVYPWRKFCVKGHFDAN